jgi:hypothetical protein
LGTVWARTVTGTTRGGLGFGVGFLTGRRVGFFTGFGVGLGVGRRVGVREDLGDGRRVGAALRVLRTGGLGRAGGEPGWVPGRGASEGT